MVPTTTRAAGSTTSRTVPPDAGDGVLLGLLSECVKNLEAKSPRRHGHHSFSASNSTTTSGTNTPLMPSNYLTATTTAGGNSSSSNGGGGGNPFDFKPPPAGGTCSSSNGAGAGGYPLHFNNSGGGPGGNSFDFNNSGGGCGRSDYGGNPFDSFSNSGGGSGGNSFGFNDSGGVGGNPFHFKPPPPEAVPLSAAPVKHLATTSSIATPRALPPPPPHLLLPISHSLMSSPSGAAAGTHHSPRKSPPPSRPHSPRKSHISKGRCKRSTNRSAAAAAACSTVLFADETNFRSIVEQHTAMPPSPASAPSPAPLLLEYPAPQTSASQSNVNPIASSDLDLFILHTPNSMSLLQHHNLPSSFDGRDGNVSILPHDYDLVSSSFADDYRVNFGGYHVPAAGHGWSLMQSGGAQNSFEFGVSGGAQSFEFGEASLNEGTAN